jgi:hypothetical protein
MRPVYKPYDQNFKIFLSNLKIYRALKYIILNTLGANLPPPPPSHKKIKVFFYVDKKCKILAQSYHPRGSSIICNWANKVVKKFILCIHIKLQYFFHNKMVVLQQLYTCKKYFFYGTTFGAYQSTKYIHMHENISTFL